MPAQAALLCVLSACAALARADRTPLLVLAHTADAGTATGPAGGGSLVAVAGSGGRAGAANETESHSALPEADPKEAQTEPVARGPAAGKKAVDEIVSRDASPEVDPSKKGPVEDHGGAADETVSRDGSLEADPSKPVEDHGEPVEGSLDYENLNTWRTEASDQVNGVVHEEKDTLDPAATEGLNAAEKYAEMLKGLGNGFDTFRGAIGDFRHAEKGQQGRQNEDVREMLQSTRVESGAAASAPHEVVPEVKQVEPEIKPEIKQAVESLVNKSEVKPEVKHQEIVPQEPRASPLSESTVGGASKEAKTLTESDVGDVSHEAEKLTGQRENEAVEQDAVEAGSVVRQQTSQETQKALTDLEEQLKNGDISSDTQASDEAVQNLVNEEEAQQNRVTTACFAISDSPLKGDKRECHSDVVKGMFNSSEKICEGHEDNLEAACNAASKCETKHVCVQDGAVVADTDGSWEVFDSPTCEAGDSQKVCVPKAGGFKLPVAA